MSSQDNHLYEFDHFRLDAHSRILLRDGVMVRLTPKAFETLLVLVQRGKQVVDRDQLLKEVWPDSFVEEGSLSRNIHELRKALGDDSSEPRYIETIPKRGYRFIAATNVFAVGDGQLSAPVSESEATVIEKHTFARVVSQEIEGNEAPILPLPPGTTLVRPAPVVRSARGKTLAVALMAVALIILAAGVAVYLRLKREPFVFVHISRDSAARSADTHAKSTLIRLTRNGAMDGGPAWSPDGSKIAFWSNRDGKNEIYVMDSDGGNVKRLTNNLADDSGPRWSPDGRKILFDSDRDGQKEIYVMDADGSNQTRLTRNSAIDSAPTWSPDGSKIAFTSNRDNSYPFNFDIYVMNADGSDVKRIESDPEYDAEPKWSPDGRQILFVTGRNDVFDLYIMNADGSDQRNLTADRHPAGSPSWSLDGSNIAFVLNTGGKDQICVMDADGGNVKQVTTNSSNNGAPSWSPDGSKLAFTTDREGNLEIFVMSVDGALDQLTDDPADDLSPSWSPDGDRIAFSSNRAGKQHIYLINPDGGGLTQLTSTHTQAGDTEPAWSPDGKRIAFTSDRDGNREIYLMNSDGSNQMRLTDNPAVDRSPTWLADGRIAFTSVLDGRGEVFAMDDTGANVTRLTKAGGSEPAGCLQGRGIAFVSRSVEKVGTWFPLEIFITDADGGNTKMITKNLGTTVSPAWSPDGSAVAFVTDVDKLGLRKNVFQTDLKGGVRRLTLGPREDGRPAFSPDGSRVAFQSNRSGNFEIYVMSVR